MTKTQLICIPFGGGNETSYLKLKPHLPDWIEMVTCALPGKGSRIAERSLETMHEVVEEYFIQLKGKLRRPYAIFGHSMGTYVGHLLIHRLRKAKEPLPAHAFFTGKEAPSMHIDKKRRNFSNVEFMQHVKALNGIPPAVLENKKLLEIFIPIIRSDFEVIDQYVYKKQRPYDVPLTIIAGTDEVAPENALVDWQKETSQQCKVLRMEGDHFFIFTNAQKMCNLIAATLEYC